MYFCSVFPYAESPMGNLLWWDTYILKAFSGRFGFDALRISQIQTSGQEQSNGDAPWRCRLYMPCILRVGYCIYIYIGVGLSALLGWTTRAMREPSKRGPGTGLAPRFCVYVANLKL